ncbi:MAG: PilN domain-containing protein [Gammaproteobacteria bacterium]|nr:PilN domain-containing protein [Gammaproteobacteria bacterium]MBU1722393.1 PilN domain-containing protein [Gammaproteobacteria bacterium]MBU2004670.1 PilN domain-containing protein [Gammaproteobacteria bacterium]
MSLIAKFQAFMRWWGEGLSASLPDGLRKLFRSDPPRLVLHMQDGQQGSVLWEQDGKQQERGNFLLTDTDASLTDFVPSRAAGKPYQVELRLGQGQVLQMQRHFPEAVKDNLRQVVGYQLDRLTPFTTENALFDAQILRHDKTRKEVLADIYVAPRHVVDRLVRQMTDAGIDGVDVISVGETAGKVRLGREQDAAATRGWSMIPLYLFIGALALSLLAPLGYKFRRLEQVETALAEVRKSSAEQMTVRDKLMEAEDALHFLEEKRRTSPVALDVVEKLSTDIPDHTWLERLSLDGRMLEIRGESGKALNLIDILEEAPEFADVRFKSPVTRNKDNGRDRFHIEATVEVAHAE